MSAHLADVYQGFSILHDPNAEHFSQKYFALRNGKRVAEAPTSDGLKALLRELKFDEEFVPGCDTEGL